MTPEFTVPAKNIGCRASGSFSDAGGARQIRHSVLVACGLTSTVCGPTTDVHDELQETTNSSSPLAGKESQGQ